ncbi:MAG: argininosuccinate lyase [Gemmataceae bacterium]
MSDQDPQTHERASKTWGGRFAVPADPLAEKFTESVSVDQRLLEEDIRVSQAHARMLAHVGLIGPAEAEQLVLALERIAEDFRQGRIPVRAELEDIHTHIEHELIARLGDLGRKLHTGRSRNDQVATDLRLWVRQALDRLDAALADLQRAFLHFAEREHTTIVPGYTHLQRAQPVLAAHYALAYIEKLQRDRDRLRDTRRRVNQLPLGAAALAGTSLPIDRDFVRRELDFDEVMTNSLDAVSDRDFVAEFLFDLALLAVHLSGWAEEWIVWSTCEFGFLELPEAFCTGSSIMPHKKNPDVLELIRARSGRVLGALQHLLVVLKGLPLAYHRDLQEDKLAVFAAYDTVLDSVRVATALIERTRLRREALAARLDEGFLDATALMELLVARGMPLRAAHEAVGRLVRQCEEQRLRLCDLPAEVFESVQTGLAAQVANVLGPRAAVAVLASSGSSAPDEVHKQLDRWRRFLSGSAAQGHRS